MTWLLLMMAALYSRVLAPAPPGLSSGSIDSIADGSPQKARKNNTPFESLVKRKGTQESCKILKSCQKPEPLKMLLWTGFAGFVGSR